VPNELKTELTETGSAGRELILFFVGTVALEHVEERRRDRRQHRLVRRNFPFIHEQHHIAQFAIFPKRVQTFRQGIL
jgi:hypothetical protein